MKKLLAAFLLSVIFVSCSKDSSTDVPEEPTGPFVMTAGTESVDDSKVTISQSGNVFSRLWDNGDEFLLFDLSGNLKFTLSSGAGTSSGTFSGTEPSTADVYYAVYPYPSSETGYTLENGVISVTFPSDVTYDGSNSFICPEILVSKSLVKSNHSFKAATCVLKLTVSAPASEDLVLSNFKVMGNNNEKIAGSAQISFNQDGSPSVVMQEDATSIFTVNFDSDNNTITANTSKDFYIPLPPVLTSGFRVIFTTSDMKQFGIKSTSTALDSRNVLTVMPNVTVQNTYNVVYGNSNCYLLTPGTNSVDIDITPYSYNSKFIADYTAAKNSILPYSSVQVDEFGSSIKLEVSSTTISSDYKTLSVTLPESGSGSAVVAIKDSDGDILWSYHIWRPSLDVASSLKTYTVSSKTYQVLPLPLGAKEVPPTNTISKSAGLLYQWGRKDPFSCVSVKEASYFNSVDELYRNISLSIKSPFKLASRGSDNYNWCVADESSSEWKYLWGDFENPSDISVKTVFDPSPEGYRVAPAELYSIFKNGDVINAESNSENGYNFYCIANGASVSEAVTDFYPIYSYIQALSPWVDKNSGTSYYWSSTPKDALQLMNGSVKTGFEALTQCGCCVKCVKMPDSK